VKPLSKRTSGPNNPHHELPRQLLKLFVLGSVLQLFVLATVPASAAGSQELRPHAQADPAQNIAALRRLKCDGELQRLYNVQITRQKLQAQGLTDQARNSLLNQAGRIDNQNPNLRADLTSVTITFAHELSADEAAAFEAAGVSFMSTPNGELANTDRYYPAWVTCQGLDALVTSEKVLSIEPGNNIHTKPSLDVSRTEVEADLRHSTPTWTDSTGNRGMGVTVAVFDTGIDVHHPDFFAAKSIAPYDWIDVDNDGVYDRGLDCVDLNRNGLGESDERLEFFEPLADADATLYVYDVDTDWLYCDTNDNGTRDYGTAAGYSEQDDCYGEPVFFVEDDNRNDRLDPGEKLIPLGKSKIKKVKVGDTVYTRGIDLIDTPVDQSGHGTCVSSIIVGQDPRFGRRFTGIAPDAELLVVDRYASPNHLLSMAWARQEGVRVYLWEFGGWITNYMDGSSALENAISTSTRNAGEIHVVPNGNLGSSDRHAVVTGSANGSLTSVDFNIPANLTAGIAYITVLWRGAGDNVQFDLGPAGSGDFWRINAIPRTVATNFTGTGYLSTSIRDTHRFDLYLTRNNNQSLPAGDWTLRIQNANPTSATFHLWIDENDANVTWSGGLTWKSNVSDAGTISWPATADDALNVASYSTKSLPGQLSDFSGRGPRLDGYELSDIAAPGHYDIACARSSGATASGTWGSIRTNFGGTSAAGPHVAGAVALLIHAVPNTPSADIIDALLGSAQQDGDTGNAPNPDWGFGKLRIDAAYQLLADARCPIISSPTPVSPTLAASVNPDQPLEMTWTSDVDAQLYDLYLGTTIPPERYVPGLYASGMTIVPADLEPDTIYYWYVVARNSCGYSKVGPISSFGTTSAGSSSASGPENDVYAMIRIDSETMIREPLAHNDEFDFGQVEVGSTVSQVFVINNAGDEDLLLLNDPRVQIFGGINAFGVSFQPYTDTVEPSQDLVFTLTFSPQVVGTSGSQIQIGSNDADESITRIYLVGQGVALADIEDPNEPVLDPNVPDLDPNEPVLDPNDQVQDPNVPELDPNQPQFDPNQPEDLDPNIPGDVDPNLPILDDPNLPGKRFDPNDPNLLITDPNQFTVDPNSGDPNSGDFGGQVIVPAPCGLALIAPAMLGFATTLCAKKRRRPIAQ
jgi:subtilisin family serine protease